MPGTPAQQEHILTPECAMYQAWYNALSLKRAKEKKENGEDKKMGMEERMAEGKGKGKEEEEEEKKGEEEEKERRMATDVKVLKYWPLQVSAALRIERQGKARPTKLRSADHKLLITEISKELANKILAPYRITIHSQDAGQPTQSEHHLTKAAEGELCSQNSRPFPPLEYQAVTKAAEDQHPTSVLSEPVDNRTTSHIPYWYARHESVEHAPSPSSKSKPLDRHNGQVAERQVSALALSELAIQNLLQPANNELAGHASSLLPQGGTLNEHRKQADRGQVTASAPSKPIESKFAMQNPFQPADDEPTGYAPSPPSTSDLICTLQKINILN
ncbi:uncharacterized protein PHACADRAFT_33506 [Phanerochaete carnosa HHB-10118-sp]|uniref:Uncharacterized protein n=1 Tax=Phanerochaete carnosa (strain HHB-10118-sp) TaxID=650164 RepID=K5WGZ2_PHACS|nr:uncharacterized protein PHACADRAFT_33506 [Phanerochaete carnosa HHB-10118-sp]EKM49477.1 hypothetical protein PHACADRAFT_33506 [Phanerochaete carnosa HHB-10118-sp]